MYTEKITEATRGWEELTSRTLALQEVDLDFTAELLLSTYDILRFYAEDDTAPKEVTRLLLSAEEFLYFASMMEEKEKPMNFYRFVAVNVMISAMKKGFFGGGFSNGDTAHADRVKMTKEAVYEYLCGDAANSEKIILAD